MRHRRLEQAVTRNQLSASSLADVLKLYIQEADVGRAGVSVTERCAGGIAVGMSLQAPEELA